MQPAKTIIQEVVDFLNTVAPGWCVQGEAHEQTGDDRGTRQSDEPTGVCPADHAPVDSLEIASTETDADLDEMLVQCMRGNVGFLVLL